MTDKTGTARQLFRYLGGEEWQDYRIILSVFADTFFSEFSADDVIDILRERAAGIDANNDTDKDSDKDSDKDANNDANNDAIVAADIDLEVIPDRLESLRRWGNLAASTSVGNPASLDDYYRRRHRYLITRAGQEVYDAVEGILHRIDDVTDVQSGRLRDMRRALEQLNSIAERNFVNVDNAEVADHVRGVFDPHQSFSSEITQFFASINQWQSRFDLEPHEITFLAEVLVGYVSEQLGEIERMARPIASLLRTLDPAVDDIVNRSRTGLASRVSDAGLENEVSARFPAGAQREDWVHLMNWFGAGEDGRSRLDSLTHQALSAVRTLTANLTRLSRVGAGSASRRADFLRVAGFVDQAHDLHAVHDVMAAAFGLYPSRHFGMLSADHDDPVSMSTSWVDAPNAEVPLTLRERGERSQRGNSSAIRDRAGERAQLRLRRKEERDAESTVAQELLSGVNADGKVEHLTISNRGLSRLQQLLAASGARRKATTHERSAQDKDLLCRVQRRAGHSVHIDCPDGRLTMVDIELFLFAVEGSDEFITEAPEHG